MLLFHSKLAKTCHTGLKSDIVSFLTSFKKKYDKFPIKTIGRVTRINYSNIRNLIINNVSMEPKIALRDIKLKYKELGKKTKPSYFNSILRSFSKDTRGLKNDMDIKRLYGNYKKELQLEYKQMELDLNFCINGLKEVTSALHDYNKNNKGEE